MKKTLLIIAVLFMMASCGSSTSNDKNNKQEEQVAEQAPQTVMELEGLEPLGDNPAVSQWYKIDLEGAVCSDGSHWLGAFKKGTENKVLFLFYGGGVSVDTFTAAHGHASCDASETFYIDNLLACGNVITDLNGSICLQDDINPFKDWTFVVLPYTTGDFHCGTGDFEYTGIDGQKHILYHHGYTNYQMTMKKVTPLLGTPDALVITGFSAGGYGTSILSDDLIGYFPDTQNVTVCVDASTMKTPIWKDVAKNVWKAPEHICNNINSEFLSLDCLVALHRNRPNVKILFGISTYDVALTLFQTYFDNGVRTAPDRASLDAFHTYLKEFAEGFQKDIPEGGLLFYNDFVINEELGITNHTIELTKDFFTEIGGHGSFAKWISDAVNGEVKTYGLELL